MSNSGPTPVITGNELKKEEGKGKGAERKADLSLVASMSGVLLSERSASASREQYSWYLNKYLIISLMFFSNLYLSCSYFSYTLNAVIRCRVLLL